MNSHYEIKYILKKQQKAPVQVTKLTTGWHCDYIRLCWQDHMLVYKKLSHL